MLVRVALSSGLVLQNGDQKIIPSFVISLHSSVNLISPSVQALGNIRTCRLRIR
jgi:hypothetical protein